MSLLSIRSARRDGLSVVAGLWIALCLASAWGEEFDRAGNPDSVGNFERTQAKRIIHRDGLALVANDKNTWLYTVEERGAVELMARLPLPKFAGGVIPLSKALDVSPSHAVDARDSILCYNIKNPTAPKLLYHQALETDGSIQDLVLRDDHLLIATTRELLWAPIDQPTAFEPIPLSSKTPIRLRALDATREWAALLGDNRLWLLALTDSAPEPVAHQDIKDGADVAIRGDKALVVGKQRVTLFGVAADALTRRDLHTDSRITFRHAALTETRAFAASGNRLAIFDIEQSKLTPHYRVKQPSGSLTRSSIKALSAAADPIALMGGVDMETRAIVAPGDVYMPFAWRNIAMYLRYALIAALAIVVIALVRVFATRAREEMAVNASPTQDFAPLTTGTITCMGCGRKVPSSNTTCIYCGNKL